MGRTNQQKKEANVDHEKVSLFYAVKFVTKWKTNNQTKSL